MRKRSAATLVEIVLYFTLMATFLIFTMNFSLQILGDYHQVSTESDLVTELNWIRTRLQNEIRSASSASWDGSILTLDGDTMISLNGDDFQIQYGVATPQLLHGPMLSFDTLAVTIYSYEATPDHIILNVNASVQTDMDASDAFHALHISSSLRQ